MFSRLMSVALVIAITSAPAGCPRAQQNDVAPVNDGWYILIEKSVDHKRFITCTAMIVAGDVLMNMVNSIEDPKNQQKDTEIFLRTDGPYEQAMWAAKVLRQSGWTISLPSDIWHAKTC